MSALPDSFEILRDCRALFLKHLGALLLDSNALSGSAIQAIQHGAGAYFDEMVVSQRRGSFEEEVDGLTSSRITLVGEDDLELDIRLDNMSARLFETSGSNLWKIHLRLITLLRRADLSKSNNPVGPRGIRQGLTEMFAAAGAIGLDKKLDMLDKVESTLLQNLPALYAEINDFLDRAGIESAQPSIVTAPDNTKAKPAETPVVSQNALLALQHALLSQIPGGLPQGAPPPGAASTLLSQAAMERLIFRLNEMEKTGSLTPNLRADSAPSLENLIPGLFSESEASSPSQPKSLSSSELGISSNAPEGLAIDTMAKIFEAIFDNAKLPDALKAVISSLQITMLKLAMHDAGFFSDVAHPARQLLDRMGVAVLGLPVDVPARHPVCARLFEIAGHLRSSFSGDLAVVNEALSQVDALIAERHTGITSAAASYLPLLRQLDRRDQASVQTRLALEPMIASAGPGPIRTFIDQTWSRVLQLVWLEHGPDSPEWQEHQAVIDELLWTFQPKADGEERKALAKRLPDILKRLKAGMDRIGVSVPDQAAFLDACFSLQTRALRTATGTIDDRDPKAIEASGLRRINDDPVAGEILSGDLLLRTLDFAGAHPAPSRALPCKTGDWLEVLLEDGQTGIAHLCYVSPTSQRALLFNPDFGLALAIHPAILDKQFRAGQAQISSALSLFETAADRALRRTSAN
ncbi:MAG: DUF1631 family protein [Azonexus sp.]|nr:DUF1631 family protein [Azonexus sp.]